MNARAQHIWEFVETMYGPIVFIVYFGLVYFISSVLCSLAADPNPPIETSTTTVAWTVGAFTVIALLGLTFLGATASRRLTRPGLGRDEQTYFLAYIALCLTLLSVVGIIWIAATFATLPLCT
jgi:hypothetical protein